MIKQDLSGLLVHAAQRTIRLGTFCRKNCHRRSGFRVNFYAGDFLMVLVFYTSRNHKQVAQRATIAHLRANFMFSYCKSMGDDDPGAWPI